MAVSVPSNEPQQLRAGDTWKWRREDLADYPASSWTLTYRFKHPTLAGFEVVATADGNHFSVTVAAATTAAFSAGTFSWLAWVAGGSSEKYTVDEGTLEVLPEFRSGLAAATLDARSDAKKIYDDLLAAYKSYVASRGLVSEYTIGMRTMKFHSQGDLLTQLNYWKAQVAAEETAERLRNGLGTGNKLFVRNG